MTIIITVEGVAWKIRETFADMWITERLDGKTYRRWGLSFYEAIQNIDVPARAA